MPVPSYVDTPETPSNQPEVGQVLDPAVLQRWIREQQARLDAGQPLSKQGIPPGYKVKNGRIVETNWWDTYGPTVLGMAGGVVGGYGAGLLNEGIAAGGAAGGGAGGGGAAATLGPTTPATMAATTAAAAPPAALSAAAPVAGGAVGNVMGLSPETWRLIVGAGAGAFNNIASGNKQKDIAALEAAAAMERTRMATAADESARDPFRQSMAQMRDLGRLDMMENYRPSAMAAPTGKYASALPQTPQQPAYMPSAEMIQWAAAMKRNIAGGRNTAPTQTNPANYGQTSALDFITMLQQQQDPANAMGATRTPGATPPAARYPQPRTSYTF